MLRTWIWGILISVFVPAALCHAADGPSFFRGLNLNGPPVTIDGQLWEGQESSHYKCRDNAFDNQSVSLVPPTDPERAKMIRSSRWGGNEVLLVKRSRHLLEGGKWALVGGFVERDETLPPRCI